MTTQNPSIAQQVVTLLSACEFKAYSLYSGYGEKVSGETIHFKGGQLFSEKRNDKGRAIKSQYGYADGSQLEYTWTESRGPQVKEVGRWLKA